MNTEQAINILIEAAHAGQKVGAYSLEGSASILQAIKVLTTPAPTPTQVVGTDEAKPNKK
jgi:hypothetical protein